EVVVRRRTNSDDEVGYHVLTPVVLQDGRILLVNRGWIPSDGPSQTTFPDIPPPPSGEVTITGRLMANETTEASGIKNLEGLPDRQIMLINSELEARRLKAEVLGGHVVQTAPEPSGGSPRMIGSPGEENTALNYAYALQWWLFAAAVPVGWAVLVRRETRERAAREAAGPADAEEAEPATVRAVPPPAPPPAREPPGTAATCAPLPAARRVCESLRARGRGPRRARDGRPSGSCPPPRPSAQLSSGYRAHQGR